MKPALLILLVLFFGCNNGSNKIKQKTDAAHLSKKDSILLVVKRTAKVDSTRQDSLLFRVLKYANQRKGQSYFKKNFSNKDLSVTAEINFGTFFSKNKKHLIVKDNVDGYEVHTSVFVLDGNKFSLVLNELTDMLTFIDYKIKDVNGDFKNDFLINWEAESGCCIRSKFDVYIYKDKDGTFSKKFEFINPTFSPTEKIIRGVGYGHPRDVQLYKYRWNGLKVDTLEFIFPDSSFKKFHLIHHWNDFNNSSKGKWIGQVPREYHKIIGYDWFKGTY